MGPIAELGRRGAIEVDHQVPVYFSQPDHGQEASEGQEVISFMSHLNQVGQTGSSPRHAKGLATCCHGEEPHVVGWRFIKERRAVNTDPGCGWARGKADVLYVADAFEVMAKVNELLS